MTSIRKPYGYRDNRPDEKNQPTKKKENSKIKQNLIYIGFFALIIWGLYYFMSPYQNCIRLQEEAVNAKYINKKTHENWTQKDKQRDKVNDLRDAKFACIRGTSW